jgi:uncharacterized protein
MIRGRCPICAKPFEVPNLAVLPSFPFCSGRCKLIDLGRWIDGSYALPGPEARTRSERPAGRRPEEPA